MPVSHGTRIIGILNWVSSGDGGRFAEIVPRYDDFGDGWGESETESYPNNGRVLWRTASEGWLNGDVVEAEIARSTDPEDLYMVASAKRAIPVINFGSARYDQAIARLQSGHQLSGAPVTTGEKFFALCSPGLLLGPLVGVEVDGSVSLANSSTSVDRIPYYDNRSGLFRFPGGSFYCAPPRYSPSGHLDCRPDDEIVRTAVADTVALLRATESRVPEYLQTMELMQNAVDAMYIEDSADIRDYKLDRIERALEICSRSNILARLARELADLVSNNPLVQSEIENTKAADVENE